MTSPPRPATAALAALLAAGVPQVAASAAADVPNAGTLTPFDGRSLDGWDGDRGFWSAEDGAIVGRSTAARPLAASSYLAWEGDMPADFDLRCKVLIASGNSGIQYRSHRVAGQADMAGFQADLDAANSYTGILYEGLGRAVMSGRGEQVEWSPTGPRAVARFAPEERLRGVMRPGEWNDYRIEARGTRVRHWINGTLMTDVTDGDASRFRRDGQLALQLHAGPPMEVRFRDLSVTPILEAPPASAIAVPPGFEVRLVASAQPDQGSWVSIAFDPQGRAVVSPQSGHPWRLSLPGVTPGVGADGDVSSTELTDVPGGAQGLAFVRDELWVDSGPPGPDCGLWRLRDADGDGRFEARARVLRWTADGGEHGPHGIAEGPDGAVYVAVGNHTPPPPEASRGICGTWGEDLVTERMWDPRGHAVGVLAPGGTVLRIEPSNNSAEIFATGFRNHYDLAFDPDGELFTYDSDMEWDLGAPWYRAPRIVHVVRGGEYGWRSGSGAWPGWYPDSLPPACETDPASPTGMLHGAGGTFPPPWRDALFAADWTYGRILAVRLTPDGATFAGEWRPFASGRPMPVSDLAWGPDGAMYAVTGGRGTQSGIYRIAPVAGGGEGAPRQAGRDQAGADAGAASRTTRRRLEAFGGAALPAAPAWILDALRSPDRSLSFAARAALERSGEAAMRAAASDADPGARALALLALARTGSADAARWAVDRAASGRPEDAGGRAGDAGSDSPRTVALRAISVALGRHPGLAAEGSPLAGKVAAFLAAGFGSSDPHDAELSLGIACAAGHPAAIAPALARLEAAADRSDAIRWAAMLRTVRTGWADAQRAAYWAWLDGANDAAGGFSLRGFLDRIREEALANVGRPASAPGSPGGAGDRGAQASDGPASGSIAAPAARTLGAQLHAWTADELLAADGAADGQRDLARGSRVFREAMCIQCHRAGGDGGINGPDLTGVAGRFSRADLLRAILDPGAAVSDQWRDSAITLRDGSMVVGRVVGQDAASLTVSTNPLGNEREAVRRADVERIEQVPTSSMPSGLLDARTKEEILDLLAYLEAGGGTGTGAAPGASTGAGAAGGAGKARGG